MPDAHKIKVVLVEDHVVVRQSIRRFLEDEEDLMVVGEAGDGEEAIRLAGQLNPDVVVMDVAMPNINGVEATRRIKQAYPSIAVLALSAYDYDQYVFALLEAGAAGYLLKDVSGHELVGAIRAVCRGDSVLHPAVARKVVGRFRRPWVDGGHRITDLLTGREMDVLKKAARGMSNKDIASELSLSLRSVETTMTNIFNKLKVGSRTEAVVHGLKNGWFTLEDINQE